MTMGDDTSTTKHLSHRSSSRVPRRFLLGGVALCILAVLPQIRLSAVRFRCLTATTTTPVGGTTPPEYYYSWKTPTLITINNETYLEEDPVQKISFLSDVQLAKVSPSGDDEAAEAVAAAGSTSSTAADQSDGGDSQQPPKEKKSGRRPNLLFILVDQMRWDTLGFVQRSLPGYAGKLTIRTPNLDRLAERGHSFEAYSATTPCVPSRGCLKTGCTVRRTGISGNDMDSPSTYQKMDMFKERVERLQTFEQILVEELGYTAELYGKHHLPDTMIFGFKNKSRPIYSNTFYDFARDRFEFRVAQKPMVQYITALDYLLARDNVTKPVKEKGMRDNWFSRLGYTPIRLDSDGGGSKPWVKRMGRDTLSAMYTPTAVLGQIAVKALDRLTDDYTNTNRPFIMTVSALAPHSPHVAAGEYMDPYFRERHRLFVTPSFNDTMVQSAYKLSGERRYMSNVKDYGWTDPDQLSELIAIYYGMVEEIDVWVGKLIDVLDEKGQFDNTMIIFTSDHGEMLGSHGTSGKQFLLEEGVRVPLVMSLPKSELHGPVRVREHRVTHPVSHLDLFSTILDYLGAPKHLDNSDGESLRRFIERQSYNENFDESFVVAEFDYREPSSKSRLTGKFGGEPSLMVRKGPYKLILPRAAESPIPDMMYNLQNDPYEVRNLLRGRINNTRSDDIGKAEHLKLLLGEWMQRRDGTFKYYSDNKYNNYEGDGDIAEVRRRRTWRELPLWVSDRQIQFDVSPEETHQSNGTCRRNEYLYVGRTSPGLVTISNITVSGPGERFFRIVEPDFNEPVTLRQNDHLRIKVALEAEARLGSAVYGAEAALHVETDVELRQILLTVAGGWEPNDLIAGVKQPS